MFFDTKKKVELTNKKVCKLFNVKTLPTFGFNFIIIHQSSDRIKN